MPLDIMTSTHSRKPSTASRSSPLVVRNTYHNAVTADILVERFTTWKVAIKQLIAFFEGVSALESRTAKELTRLSTFIQVPFPAANLFLKNGGIQDIFHSVKDKTHTVADEHTNFAKTIDSSIVHHLQTVKAQLKTHIENIENGARKLSMTVAKERQVSEKLINELASSVTMFKHAPKDVTSKSDPYVVNAAVRRQLFKQVSEENALLQSTVITQQNSAGVEAALIRDIQTAWQTFEKWDLLMSTSSQQTWTVVGKAILNLIPDLEWNHFSTHTEHLLDPETPLRDPTAIKYPSQKEPSVLPIRTGHLERKTKYTHTFKESCFVLTMAGFLHEYGTIDPLSADGASPAFSLFLPTCFLGPPSFTSARSPKFTIHGKKDGMTSVRTGTLKILDRSGEHAWVFRSKSHECMMEWWNAIMPFCMVDPVTGQQKDMSGPVAAAVRSAGYKSGDEETTDEDAETAAKEDAGMDIELLGYPHSEGKSGYVGKGIQIHRVEKKTSSGGIRHQASNRQPEETHAGGSAHVKFGDKPPNKHTAEGVEEPGMSPSNSKLKEKL